MAASRNAPGFETAFAQARIECHVVFEWQVGSGSIPVHENAARFFGALERSLSGKLPEVHGGPFVGRFTVGNLWYQGPIGPRRPIEPVTMLAFEIAFYLRMHTAARAQDSWQTAQAMPSDGRPCMPVVAAFCTAALGVPVYAGKLGDRLRKLSRDVGLGEWPQPE